MATPTPATVLTILASLAATSAPLAQEAPPQDTTQRHAPHGLLSGPSVDAPPTIVRYGFNGRLERLESRPELAAALLIAGRQGVSADVTAALRQVAADRADALRMLMVDDLDTIAAISDLVRAGEEEAARDQTRTLWQRFDPHTPYAPMLEPLADVLGDEHEQLLRDIVNEYWSALLAERMGPRLQQRLGIDSDPAADSPMQDQMQANPQRVPVDPALVMQSDDPVVLATRDRLAFQMFQQEIRQAYDQTLARYRELLESIDQAVSPTQAQSARVREIVLAHIKDTRLQATPSQRRQTMLAIYREFDQTQRERLYDLLLRQVVPD